jgi:hypothetical protein
MAVAESFEQRGDDGADHQDYHLAYLEARISRLESLLERVMLEQLVDQNTLAQIDAEMDEIRSLACDPDDLPPEPATRPIAAA